MPSPTGRPARLSDRVWGFVLLLAAADSLVAAVWALLRPDDLLTWLQLKPTPDRLLLWRALGMMTLTHVPFLTLAAFRPAGCWGLALPPLLGRALTAAVWLWIWGAGRAPAESLLLLLAHDAVWPPCLAAVLWMRRCANPSGAG